MTLNKMKVSCIQLNMEFGKVDNNYQHAIELIRKTVETEKSDVVVLPETWSTGYYPTENLESYCESNGDRIKREFSALAKELNVNIVGGSIANFKDGKIKNTSYIFNRNGEAVGEYDKTHLFTPMNEDDYFEFGDKTTTFELDGHKCGIIICYDVRFCELVRTLALQGIEILFMVSQWPDKRVNHLMTLTTARAIENQMFVACCNSCGKANATVFGGHSQIIDPWGEVLVRADADEKVITAECDFSIIKGIRESINVFNDRKTEIYKI